MVYSFQNDYSEGACKEVLEALVKTNYEQNVGYGLDKHCLNATKLIKKAIKHDDVDIHYVTGGTPCNVLAISLLRAHEAVICCTNGHINTHETGAVEATGHKIIQTKAHDGKVCAKDIEEVVKNHPDEHMVKPKMVFISNPSEYGTIYSKKELKEISKVCKKNGLYLYLDGARLGACLASKENDLSHYLEKELYKTDDGKVASFFKVGDVDFKVMGDESTVLSIIESIKEQNNNAKLTFT